jgi:integrase/recombinase XerD
VHRQCGPTRSYPLAHRSRCSGRSAVDRIVAHRSPGKPLPHPRTGKPVEFLLTHQGCRISVDTLRAELTRAATEAGLKSVTPHQLRHTSHRTDRLRGVAASADGHIKHKTLAMTMIYARIADKTVADEYFAVTEKVEALYDQPRRLASDDEGHEMRKLRSEMHRRMLGNGYCARPVEMDCHFESICESCSFFVTTIEFRPTLQRQRDDAARKGQLGRQKIFDGILDRLDTDAS